MCKTEKETYKSFRTLLEMRNWGNMSTTAHGTLQSRWRCEENLFEGTGAFSSTVRSRPGPALARAPGLQPCLNQEAPTVQAGGKPSAALQQHMPRAGTKKDHRAKSRSRREPEVPVGSSWWRGSRHIPDFWSWRLSCVLLYLNSHFSQFK